MKLIKYKAILFDGDGVLWKSDQPINGLRSLFDFLAEKGVLWALLTNNNSHTVQNYIDKFAGIGMQVNPRSIFSSSTATASYLLDQYGSGTSIHVVGSKGLICTLREAGFNLTHGEDEPQGNITAVIAGMDLEINYQKIKIAMRLILNGAAFVATNTDGAYPTSEGINPATGMVIGALQSSSGVTPYVVGKPHMAIFKAALNELGAKPKETLMVGDRLDTDILGANQIGIHSAAVLTGITSHKEIGESTIKPDFIFENINTLQQALAEVYA